MEKSGEPTLSPIRSRTGPRDAGVSGEKDNRGLSGIEAARVGGSTIDSEKCEGAFTPNHKILRLREREGRDKTKTTEAIPIRFCL